MKNFISILFLILSLNTFAQISTDGLLAYYPLNGDVLDYGPNNYKVSTN